MEGQNGVTGGMMQEGLGSNTNLGLFCVEFACSPRIFVGFLQLLWFPPTVMSRHAGRLIGDFKLPTGLSV
uniref:Uncharacterized protein n=1 Tax=Anguilla anguilla TaxID=7936 RepID=A0A0E9SNV0_ANGAN